MSVDSIPIARPFLGEPDFAKLVTLLRAIADADGEELTISIDDLRFEWIDDEDGWIRDLRVWEVGDRLVAAFGVWHEVADVQNHVYGEVHAAPDWRDPVFIDEVIRETIAAIRVLVDRPVRFHIGSNAGQTWKRSGLERVEFSIDRYFNRMSASVDRELPKPELPEGFVVRPMHPDRDEEAWVIAHDAAFAEHYLSPTMTVIEKKHRMGEASYLANADLVLVDPNNQIIGIGTSTADNLDDGTRKGWIGAVALMPEFRGRGMGRALLLASMAALKDEGFTRVHLSVDSDNQFGAQRLYLSTGFTVDSQVVVYVRSLDPT